jgi:hypothetical protein
MDLKAGNIILVRGKGSIIGEIIDDFEKGTYCHAAGYIKDDILIEANGINSASYNTLYEYTGKADVFICDILTDNQRQRIVDYAKNQIKIRGKYDWKLILLEACHYIFNWMPKYKEPFNKKICSVLWYDAYKSVGIDLTPSIEYPSPQDLFESKLLRKVGSI